MCAFTRLPAASGLIQLTHCPPFAPANRQVAIVCIRGSFDYDDFVTDLVRHLVPHLLVL